MEFLYTLQASQSTLSMDHTKLKDAFVLYKTSTSLIKTMKLQNFSGNINGKNNIQT